MRHINGAIAVVLKSLYDWQATEEPTARIWITPALVPGRMQRVRLPRGSSKAYQYKILQQEPRSQQEEQASTASPKEEQQQSVDGQSAAENTQKIAATVEALNEIKSSDIGAVLDRQAADASGGTSLR